MPFSPGRLAAVVVLCVAAGPAAAETKEPFAFADFTWLTGNPRTKDSPFGNEIFTGEFRVDVDYVHQFQAPSRSRSTWAASSAEA